MKVTSRIAVVLKANEPIYRLLCSTGCDENRPIPAQEF